MRALAFVVILFAVGLIVGLVAFAYWAGLRGDPLEVVTALFLDAPRITQLLSLAQIPMGMLGVVFGVVLVIDQSRTQHSIVLSVLGLLPPLLGVLMLINQGAYIHRLVVSTHTGDAKVFGVSVAESLLPLGLGLLAAVPAVTANAILVGRAARKRRGG